MALKPTLAFRQIQRLAVTQKMQQSVAILAMSNTQLTEFLRAEQSENPLLKLTEPQHFFGSGQSPHEVIENTVASSETLIAGLFRQLNATDVPSNIHAAVETLIANLNSKGLLDDTAKEIAQNHKLPLPDVTTAIAVLQGFEPSGVGAGSLLESVELQLRSNDLWSKDIEKLLGALAQKVSDIARLARLLHLPETRIKTLLATIRSASANPADRVNNGSPQHILPDVIFQISPPDRITVILNEQAFPKLQADSAYLDGSLSESKEVKDYLNDRMQRIKWLNRALEKRASTILRISIAISYAQPGFFKSGSLAITPLTMQTIASTLDIHESTVSRAISGKFALCPHRNRPAPPLFLSRDNRFRWQCRFNQIDSHPDQPAY